MFCEKAQAAIRHLPPPSCNTIRCGRITVMVADEDKLGHVDFRNMNLILIDMQNVSNMSMEASGVKSLLYSGCK